jgi:hypothetical protein
MHRFVPNSTWSLLTTGPVTAQNRPWHVVEGHLSLEEIPEPTH